MPKGSPGQPRNRKLTKQQRVFVASILAGDLPQRAFKRAYPSSTPRALKGRPYKLLTNKRVKAAIEAGRAGAVEELALTVGSKTGAELMAAGVISREIAEGGLSRVEKRQLLKRIALRPMRGDADRLRMMAIQTDNLMTGDNKPVRFEGEITLHGIFKALAPSTGLPDPNELIELGPS